MICFHFTIFVVLETTSSSVSSCWLSLWFAFILLSLSYWKQHKTQELKEVKGCDLLSFYYLCRTGNNADDKVHTGFGVVICFHFTIFVVLETTEGRYLAPVAVLWFAFILLSLSYWKQPIHLLNMLSAGCDLLSFYYLCRTGNNKYELVTAMNFVVICFHFTIFVVLETTRSICN